MRARTQREAKLVSLKDIRSKKCLMSLFRDLKAIDKNLEDHLHAETELHCEKSKEKDIFKT